MKRLRIGLGIVSAAMLMLLSGARPVHTESIQEVEGFQEIVFSHPHDFLTSSVDFRGPSKGYMTAEWWSPGQMKNNIVIWRTAVAPRKARTIFRFIAASATTPPDISKGPQARLFVNGAYALTFDLGVTRNKSWREGAYELNYEAKQVEWPFASPHRQFELSGSSGIYRLTVPETVIAAGAPIEIKVEIVPFPRWPNSWFMIKERRDTGDSSNALAEQVAQLQREINRVKEANQVLATNEYHELVDAREMQHFLIYSNGYRHTHPDDLIPLRDGEILLTFREATDHISPDGDVILLRSRDHGKSWGERQVVGGLSDLDEREGCGLQLKDGTILMNIFVNALYRPDGTFDWLSHFGRNPGYPTGTLPGRRGMKRASYTILSNDNGRTWSKPQYVTADGMPSSDIEGPTDAPLEMPDGSILMPMEAYYTKADPQNWSAFVLKSTDKGRTWRYLSTIADDPGGKLGYFEEPALVRLRTGKIIAAMRNSGPANAIWISHSNDDGKTWSKAAPTPMIGHPADLLQLKDGRVLCTYGYRAGRHGNPAGIRACFSRDDGETWDINNEVVLRRDFFNSDIGYPESMQLPDGRVLTAYYFNTLGRYYIGGTFWQP